jgi:hypothetical protein
VTLALIIAIPQSAQADEVSITKTTLTTKTGDPSTLSYFGDTWTLSFCSKIKGSKNGFIQVKSGNKWRKLLDVSKTKTTKNVSQCKRSHPYLTEFTYTETEIAKRQYRVYVPKQSGYRNNFKISKKQATNSGSGNWSGASKLENCYFGNKKLAGSVYFSNSEFGSDFTIYESSSFLGSDLSVYLDPTTTFASIATCGEWHVVSSAWQADFVVYQTSSPLFADFTVNYVSFSWNAGLN